MLDVPVLLKVEYGLEKYCPKESDWQKPSESLARSLTAAHSSAH